MSNVIKISLTINLEGSTLVRKSEPEVIKWVITAKDLHPLKKWKDKEGFKIVRKGKATYYPCTIKPASQHINISEESYKYMISSECPYWSKPKVWNNLSEKERLEAHLQRTAESLGGKSYTYVILED